MGNFKNQVLDLIKVPVQKVIVRKDKWGEIASVYFYGQARTTHICSDEMEDKDMVESFLHSVNNGSGLMIEEAKRCYGEDYRKYLKLIN